jgi:hypothetical protein
MIMPAHHRVCLPTPFFIIDGTIAEIAAAGARMHMHRSGYLHATTISIDVARLFSLRL